MGHYVRNYYGGKSMKKNLLSVLLALVLVLGLTVFATPAVFAEEGTETTEPAAHSHCYCINAAEGAVPETHTCEEGVTWEALTTSTAPVDGGHYYLTKDTANGNFGKLTNSSAKKNVTICLNGFVFKAQTAIKVQNGNTINICDCQGGGQVRSSKTDGTGIAVHAGYNKAIVNLYSGTISGYIMSGVYGRPVIVDGGTFNMYGGSIINGDSGTLTTDGITSNGYGGNVFIKSYQGSSTHVGTFNLYGGTIKNGKATVNGGNIYVLGGALNIYGGIIENGSAVNGGNIATNGGYIIDDQSAKRKVDLTISGGTIQNGTATNGGGNVYLQNTTNGSVLTMTGGTITAGKAVSGGNVYVDGNNPSTNITDGTISNGEASGNGGNIYVNATEGKTWTLSGVTVSGGTAGKVVTEGTDAETGEVTTTITYTGEGGNIFVESGILKITAGTISSGIAKNGGNIYCKDDLTISDGTISDGVALNTAGNIRLQGTGSKLTMSGGTVSGGQSNNSGGNIYSLNCTNISITGGQVLNGTATGGQGGNLYLTHGELKDTRRVTLQNVTISGGKAIRAENAEGTVSGGEGGNICIRKVGVVTITDVTVENGFATTDGDNVYLRDNLNVDISGGTFTATYGGRNYVYDEAKHKAYTQEQIETYGINYPGGDAEETGNGGNISIYNCGKITETTTTTDETTGEEVTTTTITATGYVNITGATIIGGNAENGGAIYVGNGTVTLDGVTAKSCGGESGKVLHIAKNGTATVKDSTLINWGIQGSTIVNNGNLILQGNVSMPKEYNANEIVVIGLSKTQDILIKCSENANAVMDVSALTSVDSGVENVEGVCYGDGVLSVGRSENVNADGDVLNTAGLVANGVNDTNSPLIASYNAAFVLTETDGSYYLVNALIQGVTENGNLTGGGANFDDVTNDGKTSVVYYILNGDLENAGTLGKSITLNLNGHTVTGATVAEGVTLNLMDMANDTYDATKCGSFSGTVNGTVESIVHVNIPGGSRHYVILPNDDGSYSAHRYLAYISHTSLKPAQAALGFKATFRGDEKVRAAATGYGLNMRVNSGNAKEFMKASTEWTAESTTVSLRVQNMLVEGSDAICKVGASAVVYGDAFILFEIGGENVYATTSEKGVSLKGFIKSLNTDLVANPDNYNATQITAVQTLINNFGSYMEGWEYDAIMAWTEAADEPTTESSEPTTEATEAA